MFDSENAKKFGRDILTLVVVVSLIVGIAAGVVIAWGISK